MEKTTPRESWSGQFSFIIAAAASAVGLGNLWRFPASAATYGGGIFLAFYVLLFFAFGLFLLVTEIAIGRATRLSALEAFRKLKRKWQIIGILGTVVPFAILPYYCVIGGWVAKYVTAYAIAPLASPGVANPADAQYFANFSGDFIQVAAFASGYVALTFLFVFHGVKRGIERSNRILMPALLVLTVALAVFTATRPHAAAGLRYFFCPDVSRLSVDGAFSFGLLAKTVLAAMGQLFFSLSLAMGIMITYGSYMTRESGIVSSACKIGLCDSLVAFLAGVIVIPPAFHFGGEELARTAGPSLMFVSLPQVFADMPMTRLVGLAFFALCFFAALTSSISLAETCVATVCDRFGCRRRLSTLAVAAYTLVAAVPSAYSLDFLGKADYVTNNILMPVCAFLTAVFVGWVIGPSFIRDEVTALGLHQFRAFGYYRVLMRYLAPIIICLIFIACVMKL